MAIKYIRPVAARKAGGLLAQTYAQIKRDFGALVEPFTLHAPLPQLLAGAWMACRESELVGDVRRDVKEAVAATVSRINRCPYCVDAHTLMLHAAANHPAAAAIAGGRDDELPDPEMRDLVAWAAATRSPGSESLRAPPFSRREAPEIVGTAIFYHYVNRMVSVLLSETPLPSNRGWLKGALKRVAGWFFGRAVKRPKRVGASLSLLPQADLPDDLAWAKPNPVVAGAYARFAAAVDEAGHDALPVKVRAHAFDHLQAWHGEAPGLSRHWLEKAVAGLDDEHRAAGRLVLLTALAPYQVDENVVQAFRRHYPGDGKLVGALAWASFTAARRVGTWLDLPAA